MNKKVDLVMWGKNSSRMLLSILARIEEVIPHEMVGKKIFVDDHSTDNTVEIAKSFGWEVYENPGDGITEAINAALSHVSSEFFISVEHDVILSKDWWRKISRYMEDEKVAIAQGVRAATHPILRKLDEYIIERDDKRRKDDLWISIDNNIYRTDVIRKVGINLLFHTMLKNSLEQMGFKWVIDRSVISDHIRPGLFAFIKHSYNVYATVHTTLHATLNSSIMFKLFLTSPLRGLHIALKKKCPHMMIVYPLVRLAVLKASLKLRLEEPFHRKE